MSDLSIQLKNLSSHLFWDVDKDLLDSETNKKLIIQRVLQYGLINDWNIIFTYYGIDEIANTAKKLKDLDRKSVSFISVLSNIPKEEFLCYTIKQSTFPPWNF